MPINTYSINVSIKAFSQLKHARCSSENDQMVALEKALVEQRFSRDALVAIIRNIYDSNISLASHFEEYYWILLDTEVGNRCNYDMFR